MPFVIDLVADEPCKSVSVSTILMTGHSIVEINREKPSLLCASSLIDSLSTIGVITSWSLICVLPHGYAGVPVVH